MGLPWYALLTAGGIVGGILGVYLWRRLKAAEQDRMTAAGLKAKEDGDLDAAIAELEAERAANAAKKRANDGW